VGYAGHFSKEVRSAVSLERLLADWLKWPVAIQQFAGRWLPLPEGSRSRLPGRFRPRGQNLELGVSTIVGSRVWEAQGKIRVQIGPLTYRQFERIMPNGSLYNPLCDLLRLYAGPEFDFDIQPLLKSQEVPGCRLASQETESMPFLGWNTWLTSKPPGQPAGEATFRPPPLT
jgi:type VI secretion system protein ImpH